MQLAVQAVALDRERTVLRNEALERHSLDTLKQVFKAVRVKLGQQNHHALTHAAAEVSLCHSGEITLKKNAPVLDPDVLQIQPPQPVITKDNVTMQIDTVVYYQITDPKLYTYGVERPMMAMETLTATTLRNIIGDLELDQTLTSRDVINTKMRAILDEATDPWGIKVNRVELKNILPPQDIQNSMEKQMKAERDRRQAILQAEGTKRSQILVAEGEKEAAILKADAEKQAAILKAEAEKQAAILKADGEAQAIMAVQKAMADSLALLNEKAPNDQVLKLKALEAMQKVADGKATKIIIPSELQGFAGLASGIAETVKETT